MKTAVTKHRNDFQLTIEQARLKSSSAKNYRCRLRKNSRVLHRTVTGSCNSERFYPASWDPGRTHVKSAHFVNVLCQGRTHA